MIVHTIDGRTRRLRARHLDLDSLLADGDMARAARDSGRARMLVRHGGSVPNSYGYEAWTDCAVAVVLPPAADDEQHAMVWAGQLRANKVTLSGAAAKATGGIARPIWDRRCKESTQEAARAALVRLARGIVGRDLAGEAGRCLVGERRRRRQGPTVLRLADRLLCHLLRRHGVDAVTADRAVRSGRVRRSGRWIEMRPNDLQYHPRWACFYSPYGDARDVAAFAAEANQERRRTILSACGPERREEIARAGRVLVHEDRYGQLFRDLVGEQAVRVHCPSTGTEYWLPVSRLPRTAHEAVAETFGMSAAQYAPTTEA